MAEATTTRTHEVGTPTPTLGRNRLRVECFPPNQPELSWGKQKYNPVSVLPIEEMIHNARCDGEGAPQHWVPYRLHPGSRFLGDGVHHTAKSKEYKMHKHSDLFLKRDRLEPRVSFTTQRGCRSFAMRFSSEGRSVFGECRIKANPGRFERSRLLMM